MTIKKIVSTLILLFVGFIVGLSQNPYKEISISSPNAASLGKYSDFPVSYHTGVPQIDIPIYTVTYGPLKLPVGISYHAGGLKVMEPASSVGAGWSLNAGGVITRSVRGAPDERLTSGTNYGYFSNYGFTSYFYLPTYWHDGPFISNTYSTDPYNHYLVPDDHSFLTGEKDGEPDLFTFTFGSYTGKFYFRDDRTPIIVTGQDLKIEYYFPADDFYTSGYSNWNGVTPLDANIKGFIITTPDGVKYYFGVTRESLLFPTSWTPPIEITFPYSTNHTNVTDRVISSWYLSKVESADKAFSINLSYEPEQYSFYTILMNPIPGNAVPSDDIYGTIPHEYALGKNYVQGVRLSQIITPNCTMNFNPGPDLRTDLGGYSNNVNFTDNPNTEAKTLGNISISNNNDFCKKFSFIYSYFTDNSTAPLPGILSNYEITTDKKRLKLEAMQEQSCDGSIVNPAYTFEYYSNFLPRRLSFAQDHWGFYNGINSNTTLIPTISKNIYDIIDGADRESKFPAMENGTLTKITYPTGGSTTFEFEANTTYVNATVYKKVWKGSYSVGYDGNNYNDITNIPLTSNHYEFTVRNDACTGSNGCNAAVYLQSSVNAQPYPGHIWAAGGETKKGIIVPPTNNTYVLHLERYNSEAGGRGADISYSEIVPTSVQSNVLVGGLRIKSITNYDPLKSENLVTSYSYEVDGKSTGILYSRPRYVQTIRNDIVKQFGFAGNYGGIGGSGNLVNDFPNGCLNSEYGNNSMSFIKSPCPIIPMTTTQGNHIGYNEVKVSQSGNGYSVYRYYGSNIWDLNNDDVAYRNIQTDVCDPSMPNLPAAPEIYEYNRGNLKYEGYYNESGSLIKDITYTYGFDSSNITTPGYKVESINGALLGTYYDLKQYRRKQTQVTERNIVPGTPSYLENTNTVYYESPYHFGPTKSVTTNSKGESIETRTKYTEDYRVSECDNIPDGFNPYMDTCSYCYQQYLTHSSNCSNLDCIFWNWIDYKICIADRRKYWANYRRINFTGVSNNFPSNTFNTAHNHKIELADNELKPILVMQNNNMNVPVEITSWKDNKLVSSEYNKYIVQEHWLQNYGVLKNVYPSEQRAVKANTLIPSFIPSNVNGNTIDRDNNYDLLPEASVQYDNGNVVQVTSRSGINISYIWGYNNSYPIVKAVNMDYGTLKDVYDAVNGNLSQLRNHTALSKAQITTYTYSPLLGVLSETNPAGIASSYEYDALGRLIFIKDNNGNILKKYEYQYHQN